MRASTLLPALIGLASTSAIQKRDASDVTAFNAAVAAAPPDYTPLPGDEEPELDLSSYDQDAVVAAASSAAAAALAAGATAAVIVADDSPAPTAAPSASAAMVKRAACVTRTYNGPRVTTPTDSPSAFLNYAPFHATAQNAALAANIPAGYALIPGFVDLDASVLHGNYLTYVSSKLSGYDLQTCADLCDNKIKGCTAFNIYYERVPLIYDPTTHATNPNLCPGTTDSPSATLIKCDFFGKPPTPNLATNTGQAEQDFHFVKAGSNAYKKSSAPTVDGYDGPISFGDLVIDAPLSSTNPPVPGYIGRRIAATNVPYDPKLCAAICNADAAFKVKHPGNVGPCIFFDAYIQTKNSGDSALYCNLYGKLYDGSKYLTNAGYRDNSGNRYVNSMSNGYSLHGVTGPIAP